ncbi:hypothetical protein [Botrimarina colliarenosi]|uniref:hypothetical protein n=1 Tax=Botrimarina colliarenosi TaxID=2528001 RepID=UPI0011B5FF05|nr:hypothetical protein [Botrimarina colliarenosi]
MNSAVTDSLTDVMGSSGAAGAVAVCVGAANEDGAANGGVTAVSVASTGKPRRSFASRVLSGAKNGLLIRVQVADRLARPAAVASVATTVVASKAANKGIKVLRICGVLL